MTPQRPTLDTVAAAANVSRMTVSNAYNRPDQLSQATRARVLEAAARLGYPGPDPAGRSLRRRRVGAVGVLMTDRLPRAFTDPGLVSFLRGLADELSAAAQAMLLVPGEADPDGSVVRNAIVDAFVVCSVPANDPSVEAVRARRLPMVTAGVPRLPHVPFVGIDNRRAGGLAAEHLLGLGHRRFGIVAVTGRPATQERADGFRDAVTRASVDADVAVVEAAENTADAGPAAARDLLERPPARRPTAVFATTDVLALAALETAAELEIGVPADVSVVGFDDIAEARRSRPALTTVSQSLYGQGGAAGRLALALVAGKQVRSPSFRAELVVRDSTAAPRRRRG